MSVKLENLCYSYNKRKALDDINLTINDGEAVAILGKTGCGKTTLLKIMANLLKPDKGRVSINKRIGIVFQFSESQFFAPTVLEDIMYGPINLGRTELQAKEYARKAMDLVGLSSDFECLDPLKLSGGEKRKASIAGILAMKPEILLLDEVTSGLDSKSVSQIKQIIKNLNEEGITVVMVTHDSEFAIDVAKRFIVMSEGHIVLDGNADDVFYENTQLEKYCVKRPFSYEVCDIFGISKNEKKDFFSLCEKITELIKADNQDII